MRITDVRVRKVAKEGKMKAVVSITLDDEFVVHDIKVIEGEKGLFIAMPSRKASDGDYRDIAHPINSETRERIQTIILEQYEKAAAFLLTNLLELSKYLKSIIVTDPKAEIYRTTSSYFRNIGYVVKVFNLKDMRHSDRWNPLAENENINDVQTSANVIISNTQKKSGKDEFWPRAEENLLKAFLFYFLQILVDQNNLTNIYKKII